MKRYIWIFLLLLSCSKSKPIKKPFVLVSTTCQIISCNCDEGFMHYTWEDANGNVMGSCDRVNKYSIGDTIK